MCCAWDSPFRCVTVSPAQCALICACIYDQNDYVYDVCAGQQCGAAEVGPEERRDLCVGDGVRANLQFALLR